MHDRAWNATPWLSKRSRAMNAKSRRGPHASRIIPCIILSAALRPKGTLVRAPRYALPVPAARAHLRSAHGSLRECTLKLHRTNLRHIYRHFRPCSLAHSPENRTPHAGTPALRWTDCDQPFRAKPFDVQPFSHGLLPGETDYWRCRVTSPPPSFQRAPIAISSSRKSRNLDLAI